MNRAHQFAKLSRQGVVLTLPSGLEVQARQPSLEMLVRRGILPSELYTAALAGFPELAAFEGEAVPTSTEKLAKLSIDFQTYAHAVLQSMLISPTLVSANVTANPDADEIDYEMLPREDVMHLLTIVNQPIQEWRSFRPDAQAGDAQAAPNRDGDDDAA